MIVVPLQKSRLKSIHLSRSPRLTGALLSAGCIALAALPALAQAPEPQPPAAEAEAPFETKVSIHGYLSQAYAKTDGNEIAGITEEGTADYRAAALQIRAEVSPQDTFAIQLSHERLGQTGLQQFQEDVALDWIFYEHRFSDDLAIKVGKVQIPFGIYNEVRDVGTLFPFYRPSSNFYGEGSFTSETVDGVVLSKNFNLGSWRLDGDLHYGNWSFVSRVGNQFFENSVRNSRGAELWLQTPVSGLRVGAGGIKYDVTDSDGATTTWDTHHFSLEWLHDRLALQAEYKNIGFDAGEYDTYYVHLGVGVTDQLSVHGQIDRADLDIDFFRSGKFDDDKALGVNFAFRPDLVLKVEHHWNEGFLPEVPAQNFFAPAVESNFWIASLSTAF